MCTDGEKILQRTDLLDADLIAFFLFLLGRRRCGFSTLRTLGTLTRLGAVQALRLHQPEVGVIALGEPVAGLTGTAGPALAGAAFTHQCLGQGEGESFDAGARRALDQQRMRQLLQARSERVPVFFMPRKHQLKQ